MEKPSLDPEVANALVTISPRTGNGINEYHFPTGELKQRVHWHNGLPFRYEYFGLDGIRILDSYVDSGTRAFHIFVNDFGKITEIFMTKNYVKNGPSFELPLRPEDGFVVSFNSESD